MANESRVKILQFQHTAFLVLRLQIKLFQIKIPSLPNILLWCALLSVDIYKVVGIKVINKIHFMCVTFIKMGGC